jgi:hypothetical protein
MTAMILIAGAMGVSGLGIGHVAGRMVGQAEGLESALQHPLAVDDDEHSLLRSLFPNGVIRTAPPDAGSVCHDWTFGGTRYSDGTPVATLLADYRPVIQPRPADVIVYWGPSGEAVHSGVVRAVGHGEFVVIESKWGHLGRYLHLTGVSHFPSRYTYHRRVTDAYLQAVSGGE